MGIGNELKKRIEKQQMVIERIEEQFNDLTLELREAKAYMQALQDTLKLVPKDEQDEADTEVKKIRAGSLVAKARDALRLHGSSMHVSDLLKAIGLEQNKKNRLSLSGSLSNYVRANQVFTRPAPNEFGLREWSKTPIGDVLDSLEEVQGEAIKHKHPN